MIVMFQKFGCMSSISFQAILRIIEKVVKVLLAAIKALGVDDDVDDDVEGLA